MVCAGAVPPVSRVIAEVKTGIVQLCHKVLARGALIRRCARAPAFR
jgi:hypothetical protein